MLILEYCKIKKHIIYRYRHIYIKQSIVVGVALLDGLGLLGLIAVLDGLGGLDGLALLDGLDSLGWLALLDGLGWLIGLLCFIG